LQKEKQQQEKKNAEPKIRPFSSSKLHTRRSTKKLKSASSSPNVTSYLRKNTSSGTISEGMPSGYNDFMRKKVALSVAVQVKKNPYRIDIRNALARFIMLFLSKFLYILNLKI
jgi:hypothetical protein